jgi:hypothetical protein
MPTNFERMIRLAEEFFATKNDPEQLDVTPEVMQQLEQLHPATLSEEVEGDGPVVWVLLIPTSTAVMNTFLTGEIGERELLKKSVSLKIFDAVYLCSALVLPEFRQQGRAGRVAISAVKAIQKDHPVKQLFTWPFSTEGERLAEQISKQLSLPLLKRYHP